MLIFKLISTFRLFNSFPAKHRISHVSVFSLLYARWRYYTSPEWVSNHSIKNTDEEDIETSDLICSICIWKIMRSSTLTTYKWKLSNVTEWNVDPESVKLWDTDGRHLLHLCFDNITEYDPDVVLDKKAIFSAFCWKCCFFMKPTYIQALIKKVCLKLE